jgi:hypothetical protein
MNICDSSSKVYFQHAMRNLFSMTEKGILLLVWLALSSCANGNGGTASNSQPPPKKDITVGTATVAPGTTEYEAPWPFGPLGMD